MKNNSLYLYFICVIATMGGLMFGFDIAIISGAVPFIQPYFGWNELQLGLGVSSLLVGAIIGVFGSLAKLSHSHLLHNGYSIFWLYCFSRTF